MSKFTPGPWKAETYGSKTTIEVKSLAVDDVPAVVSWQGFDDNFRSHGEHLANARLIAAAPMLYEALETLIVDGGFGGVMVNADIEKLKTAQKALKAAISG